MIFTSTGRRLSIREFTDIIESGERLVMFLYENDEWYKFSFVRDAWDKVMIDISIEVEQ